MILDTKAYLKLTNGPKIDVNRRSGRSTAIMFLALSECMQNPGEWVQIIDHYPTHEASRFLLRETQDVLGKLNFEHFEFDHQKIRLRFNPDFSWRKK